MMIFMCKKGLRGPRPTPKTKKMDFRVAPQPNELTWLAPRGGPNAKTKTGAATFQGKKIVIQSPECATRMFKDTNSTTLYLELDQSEIHQQFATWIESYESFVETNVQLGQAAKSTSLRNGALRMMIWDNVEWFDASGTFLKEAPEVVKRCACAMEFLGCWVSDRSWGLKWRVSQIQVMPALETDAAPRFVGAAAAPARGYAFHQ